MRNRLAPAIVAVFLVGLGEETWRRFLPKYLENLGATAAAIGAFRAAEDFFDALYQYPGGWLADRIGARRALLFFLALAGGGFAIYLAAPSPAWMFAGLALAMGWRSMASPALFSVIGGALSAERRARGFVLQAAVKRVPMIAGPLIGAWLVAGSGLTDGVRIGLAGALVLTALSGIVVARLEADPAVQDGRRIREVWRAMPPPTKQLLIADILVRWCEGLSEAFIILWVTSIMGLSAATFGMLVALQAAVSLASYAPAAVATRPMVTETFVCFTLFPPAVVISPGLGALVVAFIIGGLREIGEPSRKSMILDGVEPSMRARAVGAYYLVRSLSVAPAAVIGGVLWQWSPAAPFWAAGVFGAAGTLWFALTRARRRSHF